MAGTAHHRAQHWQCQPTLLLSRQVGRCLVLHWLWVWAGTCSCSDTAQARLLLRHGLPHALTGMPRCHTVSREQSQRFAWFATQDATTSSGRRWLPQPAAHALLLWRGAGGIQAVSVPRATQGDECAGSCEVLLAWRSGSRCGPVGLGLNTWRRACPAGPKTQPCPASCARSSPTATRCAGWLAGSCDLQRRLLHRRRCCNGCARASPGLAPHASLLRWRPTVAAAVPHGCRN